jgi:hypothetical protein
MGIVSGNLPIWLIEQQNNGCSIKLVFTIWKHSPIAAVLA